MLWMIADVLSVIGVFLGVYVSTNSLGLSFTSAAFVAVLFVKLTSILELLNYIKDKK